MASTVGERARELRLKKGLTQVDLCKITGLSVGTIGRFENNHANKNAREIFFRSTINKIMRGLGVTLDEFMRGVIIE